MKYPDFAYVRPASLGEALDCLQKYGDSAIPLAGGQSLLATLAMRLSSPEILVDITGLTELSEIAREGDTIRIGALVKHVQLLQSPIVRGATPLFTAALPHVAHVAIRNRGTFGGSVAFADPAAELPACLVALGGTLVLGSSAGRREIGAEDFFTGLLETDLRPGELILEARVPAQAPGSRWNFSELSRRHGDFPLAGLAAVMSPMSEARLVYLGCADRPKLATATAGMLRGASYPLKDVPGLAAALAEDLDPADTPGCSAETRLQLAGTLTYRVLNDLQEIPAR